MARLLLLFYFFISLPQFSTKKSIPDEPELVYIKGGTFQMGQLRTKNDGEEYSSSDQPVHSVTVFDFYIRKHVITMAQFKGFVDDQNYKTDAEKEGMSTIYFSDASRIGKDVNWRHDEDGIARPLSDYNYPVIHVSYNDAIAYCQWLNKKTEKKYRLPTEAEWEYAARGGIKEINHGWGNEGTLVKDENKAVEDTLMKEPLSKKGGWNGAYNSFGYLLQIGKQKPNGFGLYDMTNNVWQWCFDWYEPYTSYYAQHNPMGASMGTERVYRGGNKSVSKRRSNLPNFCANNLGFRVASSSQ